MKQKYVEWSNATWWMLGFAAQSPPSGWKHPLPPVLGVLTADGLQLCCSLVIFFVWELSCPSSTLFLAQPKWLVGETLTGQTFLVLIRDNSEGPAQLQNVLWDQLRPLVQMNHILTSHPAQSCFLQCSTRVDPKSTPQWTSACESHSLFPGELNVWY